MELVNDSGWHGARLPEIRGDKYEKLRAALGEVSPDGDSLIGQTIAIQSEDDLNIIEAIGWLFAGLFLSMAEGIQLDGFGERFNRPRNGLTRSSANVVYLLEPDKVVSAGESFNISGITGDWAPVSEVKQSGKIANGFVLKVDDSAIETGNTFTISIDGRPYSVQYEAGDTTDSIISRLYELITTSETLLSTYSTAFGLLLYVADGTSQVQFSFADDVFNTLRVGIPATVWYQSDTEFPSVLFGYVATDEVLILANGSQGYLIEDDEPYRERLQAAAAAGKVNISASRVGIKNAVAAVDGVSYVSVDRNRGIDTNEQGIPGKSVQVFVAGGADNDVAQAIYNAAAGECGFYGDSSGTATDGTVTETVYFTRQSFQLVFVDVSGDVWDTETTGKPEDFKTTAKTAITAYFSQLAVGRDVFAGQIYARLLTAFPTLTDITVKVGTVAPATSTSVTVGSGIVAVTDSTSITVA